MEAILITNSKGYSVKKRKRNGQVIVDCSNWAVEFEKHLNDGKENKIQFRSTQG